MSFCFIPAEPAAVEKLRHLVSAHRSPRALTRDVLLVAPGPGPMTEGDRVRLADIEDVLKYIDELLAAAQQS